MPQPLRLQRLRTGDLGGLLALEARLEGGSPGLWLLDSGSTDHLIDAALASRLGLASESSVPLVTMAGRQRVSRVRLPALDLGTSGAGQAVAVPASALAVDLQPLQDLAGEAVQGLIGMPALAGRVTRIDLAGASLVFDAPVPGPRGAWIELPLRLEGGLPVLAVTLAPGLGGDCLFDTGNAGAVVLYAHAADDRLRDRPLPELVSRELGGEVGVSYARSLELSLGGLRRRDVPVVLERGPQARRGAHFDRLLGSVGAAVFEGCRLTLDLPRSRLLVEGDASGALPGGFGFAVSRLADQLVLDRVLADGPAARAGLLAGDLLLEVDGRPAPARPAGLWAWLHGRDSARFGLQRGDRVWQQTLVRSVFLPPVG